MAGELGQAWKAGGMLRGQRAPSRDVDLALQGNGYLSLGVSLLYSQPVSHSPQSSALSPEFLGPRRPAFPPTPGGSPQACRGSRRDSQLAQQMSTVLSQELRAATCCSNVCDSFQKVSWTMQADVNGTVHREQM